MRLPDIPYLLCKTLAELIALPFHVAWFLVRRGAIGAWRRFPRARSCVRSW